MSDDAPLGSVPRLSTPRLLLREQRVAEFDAYAQHRADVEANAYVGGAVDRRRAWTIFAALSGQWMLTGAGWWAIEVRETGEFIGLVGAFFRDTSLPIGPDADIELGWNLFQPFWRKGYGTEAARAVLAFVSEHHRSRRVIAHILPPNVASIGVAKAIGMVDGGEVDFYGEPIRRWVLERSG